ncbi:MAG: DedA family protein [Acidimicrobiales bacterium]|nr:MAG: DedA family protein [Acidimicrobiales bacterium]
MAVLVANIVTDLTDWLDEFSSNWWFLLVIFAVALLDSVIPIVPGETTVIAGGVAAGAGNQTLALVILAGALGAFLGDNLAYTIGNRFEPRVNAWAARKPKRADRLEQAGRQIRKRGGPLLITARFIPGGRTVLTVSSGLTRQPRRWFATWVAVAALIWATYAAGLGYLFGQAFEDDHAIAFWLAFGTALGLTALIEIIRWNRDRRRTPVIAYADEPDRTLGE